MNLESLQRTSHVLFWFSIGLPIFGALLDAGAGVAGYYVDRQVSARLRDRVETLADYAEGDRPTSQ